jgi:peptidoglycan hydrolase-like protein with peptidoglycan-binding domain
MADGVPGRSLIILAALGPMSQVVAAAYPRLLSGIAVLAGAASLLSQEVTVNITLPQLKAGDKDAPQNRMVHRLQGLVTALGNPITIDGIFGPNTEAAVKAQQKAFGLSQTGVVDDGTWSKLIGG